MHILTDLLADLRFGLRLLWRTPGFSLVAALSLAIGIGGTVAIFTLVDAVVLRALPVSHADQLYYVEFHEGSRPPTRGAARMSWLFYNDVRAGLAGHVEVCGTSSVNRMLVSAMANRDAPGDMLRVQLATGECFGTLRQQPQVGRLLTPGDDRALDAHPVAVLSDGYWDRAFGRSRDVVGRSLRVNGTPVTIVGVAGPGFFGTSIDQATDVWLPVMMQHSLRYRGNVSDHNADLRQPWNPQRGVFWLTVFLRVPDAAGLPAIAGRIDAIAQRHFAELGTGEPASRDGGPFQGVHAALRPGDKGISRLRTQIQTPLVVLFAMVSLLLLIACANLAGLLLARSAARQRELAVRIAIGAGAGRLMRQLLAESLLLAVIGGIGGLLIARWGSDGLLALFSPPNARAAIDTGLHVRVLAFAGGVSLVTAILFGVLPAIRATRVRPADALSRMSRGVVAGLGGPNRLPLGRLLVVGQIAVTVLLLSVAALFGRTLAKLADVDLGFARGQVLLVRLDPLAAGYATDRLPALYQDLTSRVAHLPGVISASMSLDGPLTGSHRLSSLSVEGYTPRRGEQQEVQEDTVTSDYFKTLGLSLVAGRTFGPQDTASARPVCVINETMARRFFKDGKAVGNRWAYDENLAEGFEIVGVVRDARYNDLRGATPNLSYRLALQSEEFLRGLEVRTSGKAGPIASNVRRLIASVDPRLPVLEVTTLEERAGAQLVQERMLALLTSAFGVTALLLACLGLYGTLVYAVTRRTPELGVRMALGASRGAVLWLVMREALLVVSVGLALGVPLALWAAAQVDRLLYNVSPLDPYSHSFAALLLAIVAGGAALLPARRAAALEPMAALRTE